MPLYYIIINGLITVMTWYATKEEGTAAYDSKGLF